MCRYVCVYIWTEREIERERQTQRGIVVFYGARARIWRNVCGLSQAAPKRQQQPHGHRPPPGTTPPTNLARVARARAPPNPHTSVAPPTLYIYAHTKIKHHLRPCRRAAACCCTCAPPSQAGRNDDDNNDDDDKTRVHPPHPHPTPHPTVCVMENGVCVCWVMRYKKAALKRTCSRGMTTRAQHAFKDSMIH